MVRVSEGCATDLLTISFSTFAWVFLAGMWVERECRRVERRPSRSVERRECREGGCWDRRVLTRHDVRATRRDLTTKCPNECTKIKGQKRPSFSLETERRRDRGGKGSRGRSFDGTFLDLSYFPICQTLLSLPVRRNREIVVLFVNRRDVL